MLLSDLLLHSTQYMGNCRRRRMNHLAMVMDYSMDVIGLRVLRRRPKVVSKTMTSLQRRTTNGKLRKKWEDNDRTEQKCSEI